MNEDRLWTLFMALHGQDLPPSSSGGVHYRVRLAYKIMQEYEREVAALKAQEEAAVSGMLMVDDLDLTLRIRHCLMSENIRTVDELCACTEYSLLKIPNFGRKALNELKHEVARHGRELKGVR